MSVLPLYTRSRARGYTPADLVMLVYLLLACALLLFSPLSCPGKGKLAAIHLICLMAVACLRFAPKNRPAMLRIVRDWYPLVALPFCYDALKCLNRLATSAYFDGQIAGLEQSVFGFQLSQELYRLIPSAAASEFAHISYLAYAPMIALVSFVLYLSRRRDEFRILVTSLLVVFFVCYTVFILFPVKGPFHHFGPINPASKQGIFAYAVHRMLDSGSSVGTAFPSSHVAVAVCLWMVTRRFLHRLSLLVLVIAAGIFLGTVYGGFHYAVDTLVGLVVGLVLGALGPRLHAAILRWQGLDTPGPRFSPRPAVAGSVEDPALGQSTLTLRAGGGTRRGASTEQTSVPR